MKTAESSELRAILGAIRDKFRLPALAAAFLTGDDILAVSAVGVRSIRSVVPVSLNDKFHLGSNTKAITATLAAILVEQGKLSWSTSVADGFPSLSEPINPFTRRITLRDLLTHHTGIASNAISQKSLFISHFFSSAKEQRRACVKRLLSQETTTEFGKDPYSNWNYVIAGAMCESATSESYESLVQRLIFSPLEMCSAGFGPMGSRNVLDQPRGHRVRSGRPRPVEPGLLADNLDVVAPAGKVHCSIVDWAKFIQEHLRAYSGTSTLLPPTAYFELHSPNSYGYSCGWMALKRDWAGGPALYHAGSNTLNFSIAWMAPRRNFAILVATNLGGEPAAEACNRVAERLIQGLAIDALKI